MPNGCAYGIHDRGQARIEDNDEQGLGAGLSLEVLATSGNDPNYLEQDDADEWYIEWNHRFSLDQWAPHL